MIVGRRFSPCQARFRGPAGGGPLRSAGRRRDTPENPRNRGQAGALRGAPEDEDPETTNRRRRTVRPLPALSGRALRSRRSRPPGTRRAPPPVLPGRVAGGAREAESRRNPGRPGARGARVGGERTPGTGLPSGAPGGREESRRVGQRRGLEGDPRRATASRRRSGAPVAERRRPDRERQTGRSSPGGIRASPRRGRSGEGSNRAGRPEGAVSRAVSGGLRRPGEDRALLPVNAAGRTGNGGTGNGGTGNAEPGRRAGTPNGGRRIPARSGGAGPGGRSAGFPTSGTGGTAGVWPGGRRLRERGGGFSGPGGSFRPGVRSGSGARSVPGLLRFGGSGVGDSGVRGSGMRDSGVGGWGLGDSRFRDSFRW